MQQSSRAWRALVPIAAVVLWAAAAASDEFVLQGTYVGAAEQSAMIATAIEAAVADMNFIKRPIARGRLTKTNPAYQRLRLERTPTAFEVQFDERKPVQMPLDGSAVQWEREDGEKFAVSATLHDGYLVQTFKAEDGTRVNTFRWDAVSQRLYLDAVLTSSKLTKPLKYSLAYRRAGQEP